MTHYAVLIGNSQFPNSDLKPLHSPLLDIDGLAEELKAEGRGLFAAPQGDIDKLPNRTRNDIEKSLSKVLKKAGKDDLVLIYYSGHGLPNNKNNDLYLATQDTENDLLEATAVSFDQLYKWISQSYCKRVVIILDCCYSGVAGHSFKGSNVATQLENFNDRVSGTTLMTAASNDQVAIDRAEGGYSLFTKHLIDGLHGHADSNGNGVIGVGELFHYVSEKVTRDNPTQQPKRFLKGETGELIIAKSGRDSRKERAAKFEPYLYSLAAEKRLPHDILSDSITILSKSPKHLSPTEQVRDTLIAECHDHKDAAEFIRQWVAADMTPIHAEREIELQQREELTEQLQTAREQAVELETRLTAANQSAQQQLDQQLTDSQAQQEKLSLKIKVLDDKQQELLRQATSDKQELTRQQTELKQQQQRVEKAEQAQRTAQEKQQTAEQARQVADKNRQTAEANQRTAESIQQTQLVQLAQLTQKIDEQHNELATQHSQLVEKQREITALQQKPSKDKLLGALGGGVLVVAIAFLIPSKPANHEAENVAAVAPVAVSPATPDPAVEQAEKEKQRLASIAQAQAILNGSDDTHWAEAVQTLTASAVQPLDPAVMVLLGDTYLGGGTGVNKDRTLACQWYAKASKAGSAEGKQNFEKTKCDQP